MSAFDKLTLRRIIPNLLCFIRPDLLTFTYILKSLHSYDADTDADTDTATVASHILRRIQERLPVKWPVPIPAQAREQVHLPHQQQRHLQRPRRMSPNVRTRESRDRVADSPTRERIAVAVAVAVVVG